MKQKYQAYAAATQTVARTRQIVLLYDGAIRFVRQAKEAIGQKRIEDRYNLLVKAAGIVDGLQASLDFEQGGDIARLLYNFYSSLETRIFSIQRTNSLETCDEVISDLKMMRDVWHEIDQNSGTPADKTETVAEPAKAEATAPAENATKQPPQNITLSA